MSQPDRVERLLTDWLDDAARPRTPDYFPEILAQTARVRQRPAWTFLERWLPMTAITRQRFAMRTLPWRPLAFVILLLALILAAALAAGSRSRLPAPFGPAANGLVAYERGGDIYTVDPVTGIEHAIVTGPALDVQPRWSRDGTHLVFERKLQDAAGPGELYVVEADGSHLTLITPSPLAIVAADEDTYTFSPDGREVMVVTNVLGVSKISIARSDGSGIRTLELGMSAFMAAYRPPAGAQIAFVGLATANDNGGLYVVNADGTGLRSLIQPSVDSDLGRPNWSPDGSRIAYGTWSTSAPGLTVRVHVIAADGSGDRELPRSRALWESTPIWSNDGRRLAIVRGYDDASGVAMYGAVVPVDGQSTGVETERPLILAGGCCASQEWSPDDSQVLSTFAQWPNDAPAQQVAWDPVTGRISGVSWTSVSAPAWQRLAR
jgi:hypothetical protein